MSLREVHTVLEKDLHRLRQQTIDGARDPMLVVRGEGVSMWNEPARALLRWPSMDSAGVQVRTLFSPGSMANLRQGWDDAQRSSTPVQVRGVLLLQHDGAEVPADIILFPLDWYEDPTTLLHIREVFEPERVITALKSSDHRFRSFVENLQDGAFQSSPEGTLLLVNPAMVRMLGYGSADELLAVNLRRDVFVLHEGQKDILQELESGAASQNTELRLRRKDGSEIVCVAHLHPVRGAEGEVRSYEGTLKDVTAWRQVQEELRSSQERYKAFLGQSTDGIWCFEMDEPMDIDLPEEVQIDRLMHASFLKECNDRMAIMLGHQHQEEILGARMADLFHLGIEGIQSILLEYVRNGYRLEGHETYVPLPDREGGIFISNNVVGIVEDRRLVRAWGTQREITTKKQAEKQLRDAQKMETLGTLAGGVAHDFNNILGIIRGYIDLLTREKLVGEKGLKPVSAIETAVKRGAGIVRQLMTFAQEEEGTKAPVSVRTLFTEVDDLVRITLPAQIEFVLSVPDDIPGLLGDEAQLHQALMNLVINARDAMQSGGTIRATAQTVDGASVKKIFDDATAKLYVCISVSDEGSGIPETTREHLFEPFYTTKDIGKGSGLGLAVVYGVIRGHGGFVDVRPNNARGTVFHLYLPAHEGETATIEPAAVVPGATMGHETVLIVEDEQLLLDLLKLLLESNGYTVLTATDGVEAVEVYEKHRDEIAIVVSDMGLPRLGGYEAFMKMKEIDPDVKSILASGYMDPSMRTRLREAGALEFLQKPYVPEVILRTIREFIDKEGPTS